MRCDVLILGGTEWMLCFGIWCLKWLWLGVLSEGKGTCIFFRRGTMLADAVFRGVTFSAIGVVDER